LFIRINRDRNCPKLRFREKLVVDFLVGPLMRLVDKAAKEIVEYTVSNFPKI
jgi:hypothetical protein